MIKCAKPVNFLKIVRLFLCCFLICGIGIFAVPESAQAAESGSDERLTADMDNDDGYGGWLNLTENAVSSGMVNSIDAVFGTGREYNDPVDTFLAGARIALVGSDDTTSSVETSLLDAIMPVTKSIGMFLVIFESFLMLFKELQRGLDVNVPAMFAKFIILLIIGSLVVLNYDKMLDLVEGVGGTIKDALVANLASANAQIQADSNMHSWFATTFVDSKFFDPLGPAKHIFNQFMLWDLYFLVQLPLLIGRLSLLALLVEMMIMKAFFPIAMAGIATEGMRSPGVAYIKHMLGLYIRIVLIYFVGIVANMMVSGVMSVSGGAWTFLQIGTNIAIYFMGALMYVRTSGIASRIIGER